MNGTNTCTIISPIDNCIVYDSTVATVICIECKKGFYVYNTICKARTIFNTNCSLYTANDDTCAICSTGYVLTTDKMNCLPLVANCV